MAVIQIRTVDALAVPPREHAAFLRFLQEFMQRLMNRRQVGYLRYGDTDARQKYQTRMGMEMRTYRRTGNAEHLYNIAVYCFLEMFAPENRRFHVDTSVGSATRKKMGGNRA